MAAVDQDGELVLPADETLGDLNEADAEAGGEPLDADLADVELED